jgi:aminoglycoside phosphotransferase (APT) family kinase protein
MTGGFVVVGRPAGVAHDSSSGFPMVPSRGSEIAASYAKIPSVGSPSMLSKPTDLTEGSLVGALRAGWGLSVTTGDLEYLPVGFGSHHWQIADDKGDHWFLTVDDLGGRKNRGDEPHESVHARLNAALTTARLIADTGVGFVLAPVRRADGEVVTRIGQSYSAALYPYVESRPAVPGGELAWFDRDRVTGVLARLHTLPRPVAREIMVEDFKLRHRTALTDALDDLATPWSTGPYAEPARALLNDHAVHVNRLLARYDYLAERGRTQPHRLVLTHGEPHHGNFIDTVDGLLLADWDTAGIAPPERDLWFLDSAGDPEHAGYTDMTGTPVQAPMLDFYRLSWSLADIAAFVRDFRQRHCDDANGEASLTYLTATLQSQSDLSDGTTDRS